MSNFLNGHDVTEAAALNTSTTGLSEVVKRLLSKSEQYDELVEIINDDSRQPFDKEVRLVGRAMQMDEDLEPYSMHDVRDKLQRRLNSNQRLLAKKSGHVSFFSYAKGKVRKQDLLTQQPEQV